MKTPTWHHTIAALPRRLALPAVLSLSALLPTIAQAATVDLVTNVDPITSGAAQTYQPYEMRVRFANIVGTATNAVGSITLPSHLTNVSLSAAPGNAANCPAPGSFGAPIAGPTNGSQSLSAVLPRLTVGQTCEYKLTVTPTAVGVPYLMRTSIAAGSGDTDNNPQTNTSTNALTIANTAVALSVSKTIVSGATATNISNNEWETPSGAPGSSAAVGFEVAFENKSNVAVSLGGTQSSWIDWETAMVAQLTPASISQSGYSCSSNQGPSSPICAAIGSPGATSSPEAYPFESNFTTQIIQPGEKISIQYTRTYTRPSCGDAQMVNAGLWRLGNSNITASWPPATPGSAAPPGSARTLFTIKSSNACALENLNWSAQKVLVTPQSGNKAAYDITIDMTNASVTPGREDLNVQIHDIVNLVVGSTPISSPAGSAVMSMRWIACAKTGSQVVNDCLGQLTGGSLTPQTDQANFTPESRLTLPMRTGSKAVLRLELEFKTLPGFQCLEQTDALTNKVDLTIQKKVPGDYIYISGSNSAEASTPVPILADQHRCANLTANKMVNPMLVPNPSTPITFTLQFNNNSAAFGPKSVDLATVSDELGVHFHATAATCTTTRGNAKVPSGSLLGNIDAARANLFTVPITNMERGAEVSCTITGTLEHSGSFRNLATISLGTLSGTSAGKLDDGSVVRLIDPEPADNEAVVNYMAAGVQVTLTKTVAPTAAVKPGDTLTYTVTATNTLTDAANGTVIRDVIPATIGQYAWTCTAAGGASCPRASSGANGTGGAPLNETVAVFPSGSSLTYVITGKVSTGITATSIQNTAYADLPNSFASCGPDNAAGPCQASVRNAVATDTTIDPLGVLPSGAYPVPAQTPWGLALMGVALAGLAWRQQRGKARRR